MAIDINIWIEHTGWVFWHWVRISNIQLLLTFRVKHLAFVSALFDYLVVRSYLHRQWPGSEHGSGEYCAALSCGHGRSPNWRFPAFHHETWLFLGWSWSTPKGNPREPVSESGLKCKIPILINLYLLVFRSPVPLCSSLQRARTWAEPACRAENRNDMCFDSVWVSSAGISASKPGWPGLLGRGSLNSNLKVFFCDWNSSWTYEQTE